mgnify:CR=1 FL=1
MDGSFVWGFFSGILVDESIFQNNWSNYVAAGVTLFFLFLLLKPKSSFRENLKKQNQSIAITALVLALVIPFSIKIFCERSIPLLLHPFFSQPSEIEVVVKEKISQKGCRNGVKLIGYEYILNGKVCGLSDTFVSFATYGTKFHLIGEKSPFGFTMNGYRYEEQETKQHTKQ